MAFENFVRVSELSPKKKAGEKKPWAKHVYMAELPKLKKNELQQHLRDRYVKTQKKESKKILVKKLSIVLNKEFSHGDTTPQAGSPRKTTHICPLRLPPQARRCGPGT